MALLWDLAGGEASVGPIVGVGILAFTVWFLAMGVVLIRWRPEADEAVRLAEA
jgi:hypothetical protein